MQIALVKPIGRIDYLSRTLIDGLASLSKAGKCRLVDSLNKADLIIFSSYSDEISATGVKIIEQAGCWHKTAFVDGSELGGNRRYNEVGQVNQEMLRKCALYFRREKPYPPGVLPLPFGIESRQIAYKPGQKKDIDFVCIFGQDKFPPLRAQVREALEEFCEKEGFTYRTRQTSFLFWNIYTLNAQRRFYKILARAKVGVSVGGGGFDTARFWEILGNNCLLLTEAINIYPDNGQSELNYSRIWQFRDLTDFRDQLEKIGNLIRAQSLNLESANWRTEYQNILARHSSRARVQSILDAAQAKGII